jgi:hypothetical protein
LEPMKRPSLSERETLRHGGAKFAHRINPAAAQSIDKLICP